MGKWGDVEFVEQIEGKTGMRDVGGECRCSGPGTAIPSPTGRVVDHGVAWYTALVSRVISRT